MNGRPSFMPKSERELRLSRFVAPSLYDLEDHGVDVGNPIHYGVAHCETCGCAVDPSIELPCLRVGSNSIVKHGT